MIESASTHRTGGFYTTTRNTLRLGTLLIIVYWCYQILAPFIPLVLWAAIMAVAVYPLFRKLAARLGNRMKLSATLVTVVGLIVLTAPVVVLTESLVDSTKDLAESISEGSLAEGHVSRRVASELACRASPPEGRARQRVTSWIGVAERRALGPDARVDVGDDDPLACPVGAAEFIPEAVRADELRTRHRLQLDHAIVEDRRDARKLEQLLDLALQEVAIVQARGRAQIQPGSAWA